MSLASPTAAAEHRLGLFEGYQPAPGAFDELLDASGQVRPHWRGFVAGLTALGRDELGRRWELARRLIREHGITYNVYADPHGTTRPWELDPIPLLIPAREWDALADALVQRARLLNLVLADLYGPQKLLAAGLVPPELVFAQPGFLHACHDLRVPHHCMLHIYAAHLARSPDGQWWVLADRTQVPSGAGYALENRIVLSRMLPNLFNECQVQRLAAFFMTLRETLQGLAPAHRDNPRIVLLSPGPHSPTYFEDAYLARYLGYTLVAGGDLAVRDNRVFLKTLAGLLPVDVILRRLYDEDCDPLELRSDSLLGVPALVHAARTGHVAVANAMGSGLLECPALMALLPALCRHLLSEDLLLPSVETWWCGRTDDLHFVRTHLDELVIKPTFPHRVLKPIFGERLSQRQRDELLQRIEAQPRNYVAQRRLVRSSVPVWTAAGPQPWHATLRSFLVATGDTYATMPGGLMRASPTAEALGETMAAGQGSKDVWILSEGPVRPVTLLQPPGEAVPLRRGGNELPSRVADNLFWLGRYVERAEGAARLLRSIVARLSSDADVGTMPELAKLLQALADQSQFTPAVAELEAVRPDLIEQEIFAFIFDENRAGSLRASLTATHRMASVVRDRISMDSWRVLNRMDQDFLLGTLPRGMLQLGDVLAMLNQLILNLSAFSGLGTESMTRTQAWRFLDMGRRIERSLGTSGLLGSTLVRDTPNLPPLLEALLEVADSSMTYRSRYLSTLQLAPVLDLLLTDETNPRAVAFQLVSLSEHVDNLPQAVEGPARTTEQRLVLSALTSLRLAEIADLQEVDETGVRHRLDRMVTKLITQLRGLSEAITHTYLVHAGPSRQLAEIKAGTLG
jgi:uncharacterized circularly permuted ATP-grasp superfamily protein/uncharacterized alpha-E superfamily protein